MSIAAELLQRHIETLVDDHQQWQTLIADNIVWELAYAPAIGHPAKLSGRDEVLHHVGWFLGAGRKLWFHRSKGLRVYGPATRCGTSQGRSSDQAHRPHLPSRVRRVPACRWR